MSKKILTFIFVAALLLFATAGAFAYSFTLDRGSGANTAQKTKSGSGSASVSCNTANSSGASIYMQVRKPDGVAASVSQNFSGSGTSSLSYMVDGYGNSLGRDGYSYICRVAHRSQSTVAKTTVSGDWTP